MDTPKKAEQKVIVAPFWRGHVHISADDYAKLEPVFAAKGPDVLEKVVEVLPQLSSVVRHNVQRIVSAALVAEHEHGKVVLVEGCRANSIEKHDKDECATNRRHLTGSHVGMLIAKVLRNADIISKNVSFEHTSQSRCTDWEADVLLQKVPTNGKFIGIAGPYNEPSENRASSIVVKLAPADVDAHLYSPEQALKEFHIELNTAQQAVLNASALTEEEIEKGLVNENNAARIQSVSDKFIALGLRGKHSLIAVLARILPSRWDKKYRGKFLSGIPVRLC